MGMEPLTKSVSGDWKDVSGKDVRIVKLAKGDRLDLGAGAFAEVLLSPFDGAVGAVADDRCLVFMMYWKEWKILWLSDAGRLSEAAMLASGTDLKADVIVAGLHETDFSLTPEFLEAVNPKIIVTGRPAGCEMDSVREIQREKWTGRGIRVLDQNQTGGLTVTAADGSLVFSGYVDGSQTVLDR